MKLDIGYSYITQGSQEIEIDTEKYLKWARGIHANTPLAEPDEELLANEDRVLFYLNEVLGPEKVSRLIGWGEEVIEIGDVDILDS